MKTPGAIAFPFLLCVAAIPAQPQVEQPLPTFRATSNLVIVNVSVKDREGRAVAGLKKEDFVISEDAQPQVLSLFEYHKLATNKLGPVETAPPSKPAVPASPGDNTYRDRRLIVLFFDLSSMLPAEQIRVRNAACDFVSQEMTSADLVSIRTFSTKLSKILDFTDDRRKLIEAMRGFHMGESTLALEGEEDQTEGRPTDSYLEDNTEFNIFNTDRKLSALEETAADLGRLHEKKALVLFASGISKTGSENHAQLMSTINAAVRANVAFYSIDARGLVAGAPAGDASQSTPNGLSIFSGKTQAQKRDKFYSQQETLYTLATETGGKALLDSNDLGLGIKQVQNDVGSYYVLGYYSSNPAEDGRFRRIRVEVSPQARFRLDYRPGYFAPKVFGQFSTAERNRQLQEALELDNPITDLPLAVKTHYFCITKENYFVPVAVKIPGSAIALAKKKSDEVADFDFIGSVKDAKGKVVANVRDTIHAKLTEAAAGDLTRRSLQYDTGFTLPPGQYKLRFLVREDQTGKIGTFDTAFEVPDLSAGPAVRMSSVVLSSQREPLSAAIGSAGGDKKLIALNPLVRDGQKLAPNVTHVFHTGQTLFAYFEVYDAGVEPRVAATLSLIQGDVKAFESTPVQVRELVPKRRHATPVQMQVPLASVTPGQYTCQLTVIDEANGKFAFVRAPLLLLNNAQAAMRTE